MLDPQQFADDGANHKTDDDNKNIGGGNSAGNTDDHGANAKSRHDGFCMFLFQSSAQKQAKQAAQDNHYCIYNCSNQIDPSL